MSDGPIRHTSRVKVRGVGLSGGHQQFRLLAGPRRRKLWLAQRHEPVCRIARIAADPSVGLKQLDTAPRHY